jgi:hypothetical protein
MKSLDGNLTKNRDQSTAITATINCETAITQARQDRSPITTIFPRIYTRTYYAHPRARAMSFPLLHYQFNFCSDNPKPQAKGTVPLCSTDTSSSGENPGVTAILSVSDGRWCVNLRASSWSCHGKTVGPRVLQSSSVVNITETWLFIDVTATQTLRAGGAGGTYPVEQFHRKVEKG